MKKKPNPPQESSCIHDWKIDRSGHGVCRKCKTERDFNTQSSSISRKTSAFNNMDEAAWAARRKYMEDNMRGYR